MRILLAVSTLSAGGSERMASEFVNERAARNDQVALLTLSGSGSDHYALDPRVRRIGLDSPFMVLFYRVFSYHHI